MEGGNLTLKILNLNFSKLGDRKKLKIGMHIKQEMRNKIALKRQYFNVMRLGY